MKKWYEQQNTDYNDVVISSRIRLARNNKKYNFPYKLDSQDALNNINEIKEAMLGANTEISNFFDSINMQETSALEKVAMMERHVISPNFISIKIPTWLFLSKDESLSIMVNEEDHLRIQSIAAGFNLNKAWENANKVDDLIEEKIEYAYNEQLGFLTTCPTNVGTGLRASYMVHVPGLDSTGQLQFILEAIRKFGITVRGIYGEGSEAQGSVYQISNQITLGYSEKEIIDNLTSVTSQIVDQERAVRNKLLKEKKYQLEDAIYRSYGILSNARILTSKEAMTLLSDIKLGHELEILKFSEEDNLNIYEFMTCIQPANLQKKVNQQLSLDYRDIARAKYIRDNIPKLA